MKEDEGKILDLLRSDDLENKKMGLGMAYHHNDGDIEKLLKFVFDFLSKETEITRFLFSEDSDIEVDFYITKVIYNRVAVLRKDTVVYHLDMEEFLEHGIKKAHQRDETKKLIEEFLFG